jgi:hypothetical protein
LSDATPAVLPPACARALDYLYAELAVVLLMANQLAGGPPPLSELPRIAAKALDDLLLLMTADAAREVRALVGMDIRSREVRAYVYRGGLFSGLN